MPILDTYGRFCQNRLHEPVQAQVGFVDLPREIPKTVADFEVHGRRRKIAMRQLDFRRPSERAAEVFDEPVQLAVRGDREIAARNEVDGVLDVRRAAVIRVCRFET